MEGAFRGVISAKGEGVALEVTRRRGTLHGNEERGAREGGKERERNLSV